MTPNLASIRLVERRRRPRDHLRSLPVGRLVRRPTGIEQLAQAKKTTVVIAAAR